MEFGVAEEARAAAGKATALIACGSGQAVAAEARKGRGIAHGGDYSWKGC